MCGIFALLRRDAGSNATLVQPHIVDAAFRLRHRGPDSSVVQEVERGRVLFAFHRLAINGLNNADNMPLQHKSTYLICNGEIYNCKKLAKQYGFTYATHNDCECILHLYDRFGGDVHRVALELYGVFAFVIYDAERQVVCAGNDRFGVRPLYECCTEQTWALASEPCALTFLDAPIRFFEPGTVARVSLCNGDVQRTRFYQYPRQASLQYEVAAGSSCSDEMRSLALIGVCSTIRILFQEAVRKRVALCERTMGALLSGGLDSSLVAAVLASELRKSNSTERLQCFTVGMSDDAPDVQMARLVADHIGADLHVTIVDERTCLALLPDIVKTTQSPCRTTNRASTFNWLACRAAAAAGVTVLFNGDFSDEIWLGYLFGALAPSPQAFFDANVALVRDIHRYDALRSDRCAARCSLECRTPFADADLVGFVLSLPPIFKMFSSRGRPIPSATDGYDAKNQFSPTSGFPMEKWLLRRAFDCNDDRGRPWLPSAVLWRHKEAFSDAVSVAGDRSWHRVVGEHCASLVADDELRTATERWPHCTPRTKEGVFYRRTLDECQLGHAAAALDCEWMPQFVGDDVTDPSARELAHHHDASQ